MNKKGNYKDINLALYKIRTIYLQLDLGIYQKHKNSIHGYQHNLYVQYLKVLQMENLICKNYVHPYKLPVLL